MEFLLFAYEGEEPSLYRLNEEMKQLDRDKSGTVSKLEWISFLCVSKENQGKAVMRESLR
jgi:hypothetical protein